VSAPTVRPDLFLVRPLELGRRSSVPTRCERCGGDVPPPPDHPARRPGDRPGRLVAYRAVWPSGSEAGTVTRAWCAECVYSATGRVDPILEDYSGAFCPECGDWAQTCENEGRHVGPGGIR